MRENCFLDQGAVTMEVHTQPKNALNNRKNIKAIKNNPLIYKNIIISAMNVTAEKKHVLQMWIGGLSHCKLSKT